MKKKILMCVYLFFSFLVSAQNYNDIVLFHNYQQSSAIVLENEGNDHVLFNSYGEIQKKTEITAYKHPYLYQSQELDESLGLYLFPRRTYSFIEKRFFQIDPKSQYFSPYLFVGADPVNYIDYNGEEGKPLVLYGEDYHFETGVDDSFIDFKSQVKDAYYMPLSDFVNNDIQDLSGWNGNVFIEGHASLEEGQELVAEASPTEKNLKLLGKENVVLKENTSVGKFSTSVDARGIGSKLRAFAQKNKVPVKNIVVGGCRGTHAAENIGKGYAGAAKMEGRSVRTFGLRKELQSSIIGSKSRESAGFLSEDKTPKYYVSNHETKLSFKPIKKDGVHSFEPASYLPDGRELPMRFIEGEQINQMVNGDIPRRLTRNFDAFVFEY